MEDNNEILEEQPNIETETLSQEETVSEANSESLEANSVEENAAPKKRKGRPRKEIESPEDGLLLFKRGDLVQVKFSCYFYYGGFPIGNSVRGSKFYVQEYIPGKHYVKVVDNLEKPHFIYEFNESSLISCNQ